MPTAGNASGPSRWQQELAQAVRSPAELAAALDLSPELMSAGAAGDFPLLVPRAFIARMRRGDPDDPLLRQVLPGAAELVAVEGFDHDPVSEQAGCALRPGLLQKYPGRALLVTTGACAVHCRYCFRRHYPYGEADRRGAWWRDAVTAIAAAGDIEEVLLSGGDPLVLPDRTLAALAADLRAIPGLRRLRVHTRLPVVLPSRVDDALLAWLSAGESVVVIHANHPAEIDDAVAAATRRLQAHGITVLNQSVLLAGINDDAAVLAELSNRLSAAGVVPYYLHQLDRVAGAAHFAVSDERARALQLALRQALPGYLVPRLVREVPGLQFKLQL